MATVPPEDEDEDEGEFPESPGTRRSRARAYLTVGMWRSPTGWALFILFCQAATYRRCNGLHSIIDEPRAAGRDSAEYSHSNGWVF